jgi:hypothetical protein
MTVNVSLDLTHSVCPHVTWEVVLVRYADKISGDKTSGDETFRDKTSVGQNILNVRGIRSPRRQNVRGTKHPEGKRVWKDKTFRDKTSCCNIFTVHIKNVKT